MFFFCIKEFIYKFYVNYLFKPIRIQFDKDSKANVSDFYNKSDHLRFILFGKYNEHELKRQDFFLLIYK